VKQALLESIDIGFIPSLVVPTVTTVAVKQGGESAALQRPTEIFFEAIGAEPEKQAGVKVSGGTSDATDDPGNVTAEQLNGSKYWHYGLAITAATGTAIAISPIIRNKLRRFTRHRSRISPTPERRKGFDPS